MHFILCFSQIYQHVTGNRWFSIALSITDTYTEYSHMSVETLINNITLLN